LEDININKRAPLFLGSSRDDRNEERSLVILEINNALADYGMQTFLNLSGKTGEKYYNLTLRRQFRGKKLSNA
jgi:hypothetical protein